MKKLRDWYDRNFTIKGFLSFLLLLYCAIPDWQSRDEFWSKRLPTILAFLQTAYGRLTIIVLAGIVIWLDHRSVMKKRTERQQPGNVQDWREAFKTPRWQVFSDHKFANETIEVDGKSFRNCKFENVTFMFRGKAPTDFVGNTQVSGGFSINTDDPAVMLYSKLQRFARTIPGARIAEGEVDAKGNLLADNFDIRPIVPKEALCLQQSSVLKTLPVYPDDLRAEILGFCRGTTLDMSETTFFLKLSLVSDDDTGIREMGITCTIDGRVFHGKPMDDLSQWVIRTPFTSPQYPYKTFEEHSLEKFSLWKELQQSGLKSALVKVGWIGLRIPELITLKGEGVQKVRLDLTKPQRREPYKFWFSQMIEPKETIFDHAFKQV
jgi:hypothetical protein